MAWLGAKLPFLLTPTSPQSPTTPQGDQTNSPQGPPGHLSPVKNFAAFSGSGKKLTNSPTALKSMFAKNTPKVESPGGAVNREHILRATQMRIEQQQSPK
jgi:hypothetical protein